MRYFLGPWVYDAAEQSYRAPRGAIGAIDLGILPEMSVVSQSRTGCFCWTDGRPLPSEYTEIGDGHCQAIHSTAKIESAFQSMISFRPHGERLTDLLLDCLTTGSDPAGESGPVPIVPTTKMWIDLLLGQHGCVSSERFEWGQVSSRGRSHTARLQQLLRKEYQGVFELCMKGEIKDKDHHRRVLDFWCEKYDVDDWREFVPAVLQKDVQGRLKHETTYTDDFDRADATGLGASWSNMNGNEHDINSNQARGQATSGRAASRYDSDLSSSDMQVACDNNRDQVGGTIQRNGPLARCASAADTAYRFACSAGGSPTRQVNKFITGTSTTLTSDSTAPPAVTYTIMLEVSGSSLSPYLSAAIVSSLATTDTSIPTGLRGGISGGGSTTVTSRSVQDNFSAADIGGGSGILYTQLERNTRGVNRGFTLW